MRKVRILVVAAVMAIPTMGVMASPAHACLGPVCDAVNTVCYKVITKGHRCLG